LYLCRQAESSKKGFNVDIIIGLFIFVAGFALGAILTGAGAAVKQAQAQAQTREAYYEGWWAGVHELQAQATPQKEPVKSGLPTKKSVN
jgi:hypothetical protein